MIRVGDHCLFAGYELACPETGKTVLAPGFSDQLRKLRVHFGMPMVVNSCCRSFNYNREIGGHQRSLHVWDEPHWPTQGTAAIDISTHLNGVERSPGYRNRLEDLAWKFGWSIGLGHTFLHLDRRSDYIPDGFTQHKQTRFTY